MFKLFLEKIIRHRVKTFAISHVKIWDITEEGLCFTSDTYKLIEIAIHSFYSSPFPTTSFTLASNAPNFP